jgi:Fur family transcriptional regulator, zinc uptake regulator
MTVSPILERLHAEGYRDTQPRRLVVEALGAMKKPGSPYDIQKWIAHKYGNISPVTVYRVTELLLSLGLAHKHPCSGALALCAHPNKHGAHAYLHCHSCGKSEEFFSTALQSTAVNEAKTRGYSSPTTLLEISGTCRDCR